MECVEVVVRSSVGGLNRVSASEQHMKPHGSRPDIENILLMTRH